MLPGIQPPITSSTISIANLLDIVKDFYSDVLSNDVLNHYGIQRETVLSLII